MVSLKDDPIIPENDRNYVVHLTCSKKTSKLIMDDCIKEFLTHHPDFEGVKISQGFILKEISQHYLRSP